jgi:hypothetical protein
MLGEPKKMGLTTLLNERKRQDGAICHPAGTYEMGSVRHDLMQLGADLGLQLDVVTFHEGRELVTTFREALAFQGQRRSTMGLASNLRISFSVRSLTCYLCR